MKNSKFVNLILHLTTRERTRFALYVHSPFFNKHSQLKSLCDYILSFAPQFENPELGKKSVHKHLFPHDDYNEDRINNLLSDLLQLLYDFLAHLRYEESSLLSEQLLLEELQKRDLHTHLKGKLRRFRQRQQQSPERSYEYFLREYHFHEIHDQYQLSLNKRANPFLQEQNDSLDFFYLTDKLRLACEMANRNRVVKADYQSHHLEDIIQWATKKELAQQAPSLEIYLKALSMINTKDAPSHFYDLKNLLLEKDALLSLKEKNSLYHYALNHCIQRINSGESKYYREIFELYKQMINRKIIFQDGYLTQWSYQNIITTGIRLEEFDWTEHFIHEYQAYLLPQERLNAVTYNLSAFYFAKKDYEKALRQLNEVEFSLTSSYHIGAKIIQLKSYFELDETEAFFALTEAFGKYLQRNKNISDYWKKANQNLVKLTKRIYQLKITTETLPAQRIQEKKRKLHQKLDTTGPIANKAWLIESLQKI